VFDLIVDIMGPYILLSMSQAIVRASTNEFPGYTHTDGGEALRRIRVTETSWPLAMKALYLLSDVTGPDSGNFTVFPGSHLRPFPEGDGPVTPDTPGAVKLTGKAGDCFLFSHSLWHGPSPNHSGWARKTLLYVGSAPSAKFRAEWSEQAFKAADGYVVVATREDSFWRTLCAVLERPELGTDVRFATNADRCQHRETLVPELEGWLPPNEPWAGDIPAEGMPPPVDSRWANYNPSAGSQYVQMKSLTPREAEAVGSWLQAPNFELIQGRIRGTLERVPSWVDDTISELDAAVAKSTLTEDLVLWRYTDTRAFQGTLDSIGEGSILMDQGFLATSVDEYGGSALEGVTVRWEISAPKGTKAMHILRSPDADVAWDEVLFERNTRLQIDNILRDGDDVWVEATII